MEYLEMIVEAVDRGHERFLNVLEGLTAEQVDILKDKYAIYLVRSGRMCAAGLNLKNIDYVADSVAEVIKATS